MQRNIDFLLEHSGTLQSERLQSGPSPDRMKVSGRSFEDLLRRTAEFARGVVFYNDDNKPQGNWSEFFQKVYDYDGKKVRTKVIEAMKASSTVDPHLALLFAFFEQILRVQDDINTLSERQMEFYYSEILGFHKKESTEGIATIFVNLKKNVPSVSLPKGTAFEAGKDRQGKSVEYVTFDEVRFCGETLEHIGVFTDETGLRPIDGEEVDNTQAFCISSPILNQQADTMSIMLSSTEEVLHSLYILNAEYTGANGWMPLAAEEKNNKEPYKWKIKEGNPSITPYDAAVHGAGMATADPVIRFTSKVSDPKEIASIDPSRITGITVKVNGSRHFTLSNEMGSVENKAGAKVFGPSCKYGAKCEILYPFPLDKEPEITPVFKDSIKISKGRSSLDKNGKVLKSVIIMNDSRCDQVKLSDNYAKAVLSLMKQSLISSPRRTMQAKKTTDIDSVIQSGLLALVPELNDSITLICSCTDPSPAKTVLTPYGSFDLTDQHSTYGPFRANADESCLYLAIKGMEKSCSLSLFFTIDGDIETVPSGSVSWEVLDKESWEKLGAGRVLKDTTNGMSEDGCVILSLDGLSTEHTTGLDKDCIWLRGTVSGPNMRKVTSVRNHALELEFSPTSLGEAPGGRALPKGSITKPLLTIQGVKNVEQPFDGHVGAQKEDEQLFRLRVSEQLRHKKRAWTAWDYEHLILEAFPEVAYVKCLTSCNKDCQNAPGEVTLVVVPSSLEDNLAPQPTTTLMNGIREKISKSCSPFVTVNIKGASYKSIKVGASLVLRKGYSDTKKYEAMAAEALKGYFRSWVGHDIIGSHFTSGDSWSAVNGFLERLPYVDYITSLEVYVNDAVCKDAITISGPDEIITSADTHTIVCTLPE